MEEKKRQVKRFLHDNIVTVVAVLIFALILGILLAARYGSLLSIANIANINPLITTESAELVAINVNGVIKIIKDDDGKVTAEEKKAAANSTSSSTNKSNQGSSTTGGGGSGGLSGGGSSGGSSGGGSSGGGSSGGGGSATPSPSASSSPSSSPSPSPSPSQPPAPFSAFVSSLEHVNRRYYARAWVLLGWTCKNEHTFRATIRATSGSGNATLRWKHGNSVKKTISLGAISSGDTRSDEYVLTDQSVGGSITVELLNSANNVISTRDINFSHSCT